MSRSATLSTHAARSRTEARSVSLLKRIALIVLFLFGVVGVALAYPALAKGEAFLSATWEHPWVLWGLLLLPLVLWRGTLGEDQRVPRLKLGTLSGFAKAPRGVRAHIRDLPGVIRAVAVGLFLVALSRPMTALTPTTTDDEGIDAIVVLDLSGSMEAVIENLPQDLAALAPRKVPALRPTRLDAAKAVIRDFISRRKTDRIGVVVFGKAAYVLSPPTLDYHLLDKLVSSMELDLVDGAGTAIGDALGVAVARLRRSHAVSKAVILLTDGENNAGGIAPEYAAHLANVVGAKVFTVQIGTGDWVEVYAGTDLFGQPRYTTRRYPVNPELLKMIAEKTDGKSYIATDAQALQASFHDVLDRLEKTKFEASVATFEDLYRFLLLPGVLLVAVEALLRSWLLRRFP